MSELDALLPRRNGDAGSQQSIFRDKYRANDTDDNDNDDGLNSSTNSNSTTNTSPTQDSDNYNDHDHDGFFDLNLDEVEYDTLKLCAIYLAIYLAIAIVAFSHIFEKWSIIDSIYFAVSTFTTCGYGDHAPTTVAGQLFTIVFASYGVLILGVFIGVFGQALAQAQNKAIDKLRRKKEEEVLEILFDTTDTEEDDSVDVDVDVEPICTVVQSDDDDNDEAETKSCSSKEYGGAEYDSFARDHMALLDDIFQVLRSELPEILAVTVLALILGYREGWSFTSTLYFCLMSATTTGYGDYTPTTQSNKLYCVIFYPISVAVFGEVLGRIANAYIRRKQRRAELKVLRRTAKACDLRRMDANGDGLVDREEFICFMLVALQKVDKEAIDELRTIFESLDTSGVGTLKKEEIVELVDQNRADLFSFSQVFDEDEDDDEADTLPAAPPVHAKSSLHRRFHSTV
jgi:hypothetical protein